MATIEDVRAAGQAFGALFKRSRTVLPGTLGDGQGNVIGTRNNMVLVRVGGNPPTEIFNFIVPPVDNLPVLVGYDADQPDTITSMEIVGVDRTRLKDWGDLTFVPPHAHTHSYNDPEAGYRDVPQIHKRQIKPLSVNPTDPTSLSVVIESDYYLFRGHVYFFPQTISTDLTAYKPAEDWAAVMVLLYLAPETGALTYLRGTEFERAYPPSIDEQIPDPPLDSIPLAGILLFADSDKIEDNQIYDVRLLVNPVEDLATNPTIITNQAVANARAWMGV